MELDASVTTSFKLTMSFNFTIARLRASFSMHGFFFFINFFIEESKTTILNVGKKKDVQKTDTILIIQRKKLHRFTTYKYKYRVSLQQINLITILTKTRKKRNRKKKSRWHILCGNILRG